LPKGTTLGVAEETSANIVAAINEEGTSNFSTGKKHLRINMVVNDTSLKQYLQDKLGYLSQAEKSVIEPILVKYWHIFHEEDSHEFRGTDSVEHKIVTGNSKPIVNLLTEYHLPLGRKWKIKLRIC
jgi:hypothetical protein